MLSFCTTAFHQARTSGHQWNSFYFFHLAFNPRDLYYRGYKKIIIIIIVVVIIIIIIIIIIFIIIINIIIIVIRLYVYFVLVYRFMLPLWRKNIIIIC